MDNIVHIFCDGSCQVQSKAGGFAHCIIQLDYLGNLLQDDRSAFGLHSVTNNSAELFAAIYSIMDAKLILNDISKKHIYVNSDSKYVVEGMNNWINGWKRNNWCKSNSNEQISNVELWKELNNLCYGINIYFIHQPRNSNEYLRWCDMKAKSMWKQ